jgi:hypothetical protein
MAKISEMSRRELVTFLVANDVLSARVRAKPFDTEELLSVALKAKKALKAGKKVKPLVDAAPSKAKAEKPAKKAKAEKPAKKAKAEKPAKKAKKAKGKKAAPELASPIKDKLNRTQLIDHITEMVNEQGLELDKKQVKIVVEAIGDTLVGSIRKKGCGEFMFPGLFKVVTISKPATKKRKGINPFTKEPCIFKAKPATVKVKIRPMKKIKDAALS